MILPGWNCTSVVNMCKILLSIPRTQGGELKSPGRNSGTVYLDFKSQRGLGGWDSRTVCPEVCQLAGMVSIAQREESGEMRKKVHSEMFLGREPQKEMVAGTTQKNVFQELRVVASCKDNARVCALYILSLKT